MKNVFRILVVLFCVLFENNLLNAQWIHTDGPYGGRITTLAVSGTDLFADTFDGGVWRRPLSEMITSVERISTDMPTHFILEQNYPNPFNPVTTITFTLPSKSFVSLEVFDALGREISTILSGELPAGNYARQWNAESLPGGVYFYRLVANAIPPGAG